MNVVLYSTGCPKCKILEKKMGEKGIVYETVDDVELMEEKGFMTLPMLEVDGAVMDFGEGFKWVSNQ